MNAYEKMLKAKKVLDEAPGVDLVIPIRKVKTVAEVHELEPSNTVVYCEEDDQSYIYIGWISDDMV